MAIAATFTDADTFVVTGNQTALFMIGRRIRASCGVDGYKYGTISASTFSTNTTVDLTAASDDLTSNLTAVEVGIVGKGTTQSMPSHTHDGAEGTGDYLPSLRLASSSGGLLEDNQASPSGTRPMGYNGYFYATRVYNAVWNDIADFQPVKGAIVYGKCYYSFGNGVTICNKKCQKGIAGIASNTYGFGVGVREGCVPLAIGGWVLAFVDKSYEPGTALINDFNGVLTRAKWYHKLFYSDRVVAYYDRKEMLKIIQNGDEKIEVNGRHWVRIK